MGQRWSSSEGVTCSKDTALKTAWQISDSDKFDQKIIMKIQTETKQFGEVVDRWTRHTELTALTIACLNNDVKLVKKLIKKGADVNLVARGDQHTNYENSVPPIFYAANNSSVDIVKLLIDAGVDINRFQGLPQCINLQKPPDTRAIIGPNRFQYFGFTRHSSGPQMFLKVLEQYLNAGVKLNSTSWGPCLFLGRGKVYEANQPTTLQISGPWFFCTTAIILLQHGVDPNLYNVGDVLRQQREHYSLFRQTSYCIDEKTFVATFLAAGYDLTVSDMNRYENDYFKSGTDYQIVNHFRRTPSLKHLARTQIRKHIRSVNMDTSVIAVIDKLILPTILKDFLKLYDVSPSDMSSIVCYEHIRC
ncbi:uncharacterized protein LOC127710447 isoform X1 [Mytilus californianus]|uniref:uncharacterized protein LOC127710447 isoform X1 n=1 Tax=Mytilus californianus TaxID=6549 RepID=UPI00224623AE|nr:uncharacterized protein LOC127710447 isoform X1 [Mytilus californianus]XP_052072251.1 uncharacterized protein LOC127710447 isoform X1 [Mytilus californianus]XP_052072253.1 uncharacterized protein LOC127710447 isoform X1 [Mytilus californianus]XP_052072254.1 uncharacterized protein LOC127710447 isoform X1 [Mytilus californianus]